MKKRWWLAGVVLLLAIPLVWLLRDFTRDVILSRVLHIAWEVGIVLNSLPQEPLWMLLVVLVLYIALVSLVVRKRTQSERLPSMLDRVGRLRYLARRIELAAEGVYFRWDLARHLGSIIVAALAHRQGISRGEVRLALRKGHLDAPDEIQGYLRAGFSPLYTLSGGLLSRVRRLFSPDAQASPLDHDLERIVRFMESLLELQHDR